MRALVTSGTERGRSDGPEDVRHAETPAFIHESARLPVVAKRYKVSLTKVYCWIKDGLPSFRIGREHLVHVPTADAWVKARLSGAAFVPPMMRRSEGEV